MLHRFRFHREGKLSPGERYHRRCQHKGNRRSVRSAALELLLWSVWDKGRGDGGGKGVTIRYMEAAV